MRTHFCCIVNLYLVLLVCTHFPATTAITKEVPKGWTQELLKIVIDKDEVKTINLAIADEQKEFHKANYVYFHNVDIKDYIDLVLDFKEYTAYFPEVKNAKTIAPLDSKQFGLKDLENNQERYFYSMSLTFTKRFLDFTYNYNVNPDPIGYQLITYPNGSRNEAHIHHSLANHKDKLDFVVQETQLNEYENGVLVIDKIHGKIKKSGIVGSQILTELRKFFEKQVTVFKTELGACKEAC